MYKLSEKSWILSICLAVVTITAYEPMRHNDFISLDDPAYVVDNPHVNKGITRESVIWAFTTPHSGNWHSLTWLSHILDCQVFGLNAIGHHLTSLLFHIASTLLLFLALKKMTGAVWPSAFVAAVFALHPLHVESVAWVAERKDVLSGFFWMLTIMAYAQYTERPNARRYLLVALAFTMGLMSKPMLVTLPFVLLLLDYWPLGRFQSSPLGSDYQSIPAWHLIVEKVPLFVLAAVSSVVTFIVQQSSGAMESIEILPLNFRTANALFSYVNYISKMIYPSRLAIFYPISPIPPWQPMVCFIILIAITTLVIISRRRYLVVGWMWYLGTLVPVIGLVQVGSQAMADRYTYLPSIGIFIMVAWGAAELVAKWRSLRLWLGISAVLILSALLVSTRTQVQYWRNSSTLYEHGIKVTKDNWKMHTLYGNVLNKEEKFDEAITHFKEALRINTLGFKARNGLGKAFFMQGNYDEAIRHFNAVLFNEEILPAEKDLFYAYSHLGGAYAFLGKDKLAVINLIKGIELDPDSVDNLNNLAWVLATSEDTKLRNPIKAIEYAERACELTEYSRADFMDTLSVAYAAAGRFIEAIETAEKAIILADAAGTKELVEEILKRLELYKANKPYRKK